MHRKAPMSLLLSAGALLTFAAADSGAASSPSQVDLRWKVHDTSRPQPPIVTPGTESTRDKSGLPPSDAIILFDGSGLAEWVSSKGGPARWNLAGGHMETGQSAGDIVTKRDFGDCQLHVEWATPNPPHGEDQGRGNSGIYLMSLYEVQVLDSFENKTYPDGQAAAIYGQFPPLVNVSRGPGVWQTYDIIFHGPRFSQEGKLLRPAKMTILHNGVLVQDNVELTGPSDYMKRPPYRPHPEKMPLLLQDHGQPVSFRNIWIREIPD
jgi:hypothetical protein